jgi:uridine phosphorylase
MVSTRVDLKAIREQVPLGESARSPLMSHLYLAGDGNAPTSVTGPMMGAPYAVALMETLVAWGARTLLFFGWCGTVSPEVKIGDIIVPTGAIIDEGTSLHYGGRLGETAPASPEASKQIKQALSSRGLSFREGPVWSIDAPFRETPEKVAGARDLGALAVEMETSALFTVGRYRDVSVGAILVVSDDLATLTWKPGFKHKPFRAARRAVSECFAGLCRT